jgi:hypothetical protein
MGTENKESKAEETRPARAAAPEEESGKAATLVEGSRSSKLGFGADARTDEGKGSKEKKQQQKRKQQSATVRRAAPQQPLLSAPGNPQTQQIETAYALSLGFLGILIFVEGIILAASGLSCTLSLSLSLSLSRSLSLHPSPFCNDKQGEDLSLHHLQEKISRWREEEEIRPCFSFCVAIMPG